MNSTATTSSSSYWIYTFMTRGGVLCYRVWRKMDWGQAQPGEARTDLIDRLQKQLANIKT
jgi:hypothetical protein